MIMMIFFSLFFKLIKLLLSQLTSFLISSSLLHPTRERGMSGCVALSYCLGLNCNSKKTQTHYTQIP